MTPGAMTKSKAKIKQAMLDNDMFYERNITIRNGRREVMLQVRLQVMVKVRLKARPEE